MTSRSYWTAVWCGFLVLTIGLVHWQIILGLIIGGVVAAPVAALTAKRIPVKPLMIIVGCVIILLSLRTILLAVA